MMAEINPESSSLRRGRAEGRLFTVTLADVAQHAGVSPQTVSRAIRTPHMLSPATLDRVNQSIERTGYIRNLAASNLASARSLNVAVVLPTIASSIFAEAVAGLDETLGARGYSTFLGYTGYHPDREQQVIRACLERGPDGLVVFGTQHTEWTRELLMRAPIPVVEAWDLTLEPIDQVVGFANDQAMGDLLAAMIDRGYRHPVFAGSLNVGNERVIERRAGFARVLAERLPGEPLRVVDSGTEDRELDAAADILDVVLAESPEVDLIMCTSDVSAAGVLFECQRRGLSVPDRLGITGFGDFGLARNVHPRLTTVSIPNHQIGVTSGELLLAAMENPAAPRQVVDLGYQLVLAESTRS